MSNINTAPNLETRKGNASFFDGGLLQFMDDALLVGWLLFVHWGSAIHGQSL